MKITVIFILSNVQTWKKGHKQKTKIKKFLARTLKEKGKQNQPQEGGNKKKIKF